MWGEKGVLVCKKTRRGGGERGEGHFLNLIHKLYSN